MSILDNMRFVVINMDKDKARLEEFTKMMDAQGLPFERHVGPLIESKNVSILDATFNVYARGYVGVAMAHLTLWENIAHRNDEYYYIVFEDDEIIRENYKDNILSELKKVKEEFDFFNLNVMRPLGTEIYSGILKVTHKKYGKKTPNIWLSNYIITSRGARKILSYLKKDIKSLNRNFDSLFVHVLHKYCNEINTLILKDREKYSIHDEAISVKKDINNSNAFFNVVSAIKRIASKLITN